MINWCFVINDKLCVFVYVCSRPCGVCLCTGVCLCVWCVFPCALLQSKTLGPATSRLKPRSSSRDPSKSGRESLSQDQVSQLGVFRYVCVCLCVWCVFMYVVYVCGVCLCVWCVYVCPAVSLSAKKSQSGRESLDQPRSRSTVVPLAASSYSTG